jgi:hypothetical protein
MATQKTSIALGKEELAAAKKAAASEGLSLSAFLSKLVRAHVAQQLKFDAMDRFVKKYAPSHRLTEDTRAAIEAEWNAPLKPVRARRRRSAA